MRRTLIPVMLPLKGADIPA